MGEVIRASAAIEDIIADVRTTHARSTARVDTNYDRFARELLEPAIRLIDGVESELEAARADLEPLEVQLDVVDAKADALLARCSDSVWNEIGRPASDGAYTLLFPDGISGYAEVDVDEQPELMKLLVKLLRSGVHAKLPAAEAEAWAAEVDAARVSLEAAVKAVREPRARVKLLKKVRAALIRHSAGELSRMKRRLLAEHETEAAIHAVIPDRPRAKRAKKPEPT